MKVHDVAGRLHVGVGNQHGPITWFPVWSERGLPPGSSYIPADGAHLTIRETPEPRVDRLLVTNTGPSPSLLVQGRTLRGGSQDRTCVSSLLVPPRTSMEVPVACIERGRWSASGFDLHLTDSVPPRVRARNAAARHPLRGGHGAADQVGTWSEIDALFAAHRRRSATDSYHDLRRKHRSGSAHRIRPLEGQRGVVIGYGGIIRSVELFGSSRDLTSMLGPTLEAAQLEAVCVAPSPVPARRARRAVADLGRIEVTPTRSLGWGEDIRAEDAAYVTTGLGHEGSLLHLAAFSRQLTLAT